MNYEVTWTRTALDQLAALWNDSRERDEVTVASHELEQLISRRPLSLGESRQASIVRFLYRRPLGIEYEVIEDDKKVRVLRVWSIA